MKNCYFTCFALNQMESVPCESVIADNQPSLTSRVRILRQPFMLLIINWLPSSWSDVCFTFWLLFTVLFCTVQYHTPYVFDGNNSCGKRYQLVERERLAAHSLKKWCTLHILTSIHCIALWILSTIEQVLRRRRSIICVGLYVLDITNHHRSDVRERERECV